MFLNSIKHYGDSVLRASTSAVEHFDNQLISTCERMFTLMKQAGGIGLAASQVGIVKRFFVYDISAIERAGSGDIKKFAATRDMGVVVNPTILESTGSVTAEEGCLSVTGLSWNVNRASKVVASGMNLAGKNVIVEAEHLFARLIQHEVDHINGILLVDKLEGEDRREAKKLLRERVLLLG